MNTCFMMMNNFITLAMNLIIYTDDNDKFTFLEGAVEKYKVDFDAETKQAIFTFKLLGNSKIYKLCIISNTSHEFEELTTTEHFFKIVNVLGLAINMAKSKKKSLVIKVDIENSYIYLDKMDSNDDTFHKFCGWLED